VIVIVLFGSASKAGVFAIEVEEVVEEVVCGNGS
jgi:hypothetical protein